MQRNQPTKPASKPNGQAPTERAIGVGLTNELVAKLVAQGVIAPPNKLKPELKPSGLTRHQEFVLAYVKDWIVAEPSGPFILALAKIINDVDENHVPTNDEYADAEAIGKETA